MFQKEVADRILAETNHKDYGRLSILSHWKLNVYKIKDINPGSFYPSPKVRSTILFIEPKHKIQNNTSAVNIDTDPFARGLEAVLFTDASNL